MAGSDFLSAFPSDVRNFVFLGEAGCGKSEIAVNLACSLAQQGGLPVHLFDLDMTKPLFRTRDLQGQLERAGVTLHYEEQFMDAPTAVGGVLRLLKDDSCYVIMDVGGDSIGARSIGGYAPVINCPGTCIYYVLNSYRAWSADLEHIDRVLGETLGVSHIPLEQVRFIGNANLGVQTRATDVLGGSRVLDETVGPCKPIEFHCVWDALYDSVREGRDGCLVPIHLYLTYPWENSEVPVSQADEPR